MAGSPAALPAVFAVAGTVAAMAVVMVMAVSVVGIAIPMVLGIYTHPAGVVQQVVVGAVVMVGHTRLVGVGMVLQYFGSPSSAYSDQRYRRQKHVPATSAY